MEKTQTFYQRDYASGIENPALQKFVIFLHQFVCYTIQGRRTCRLDQDTDFWSDLLLCAAWIEGFGLDLDMLATQTANGCEHTLLQYQAKDVKNLHIIRLLNEMNETVAFLNELKQHDCRSIFIMDTLKSSARVCRLAGLLFKVC